MSKFKVSAVACARWEADYIVEWLNYHRSIGFEHVYLYCNDDDPSELYSSVASYLTGNNPFITFIHFPFQGQQRYMYLHFLRMFRDESTWIMFVDIDEFIQILDGISVGSFIDRFSSDWDAISLNWLFFGPNGFKQRPSGSVLRQYVRRASTLHVFTKVLTRAAAIPVDWINRLPEVAFWHHWYGVDSIRVCNVLGEDMTGYFKEFPDQAFHWLRENGRDARILQTARVCHFAFRSEADFLTRSQRGTVGEFSGQAHWKRMADDGGVEEFVKHLHEVEDLSLMTYWSDYLATSWRYCVVPRPPFSNLALGCPARQSSRSPWSTLPDEASQAVNGRLTGNYQFHTDVERDPWWEVMLRSKSTIRQICLYNSMDPDRRGAVRIRIEAWTWHEGFATVYDCGEPVQFGGIDGFPFVWVATEPVQARKIRITFPGVQSMQLDQVEIFGEALSAS